MQKNARNATRIAPPTEDCYGFWGTIQGNSYDEATSQNRLAPAAADRLWATACEAVARVFGETDKRVIRNFLRSRWGRHLADETYNEAFPAKDENALAVGIADALGRRTAKGRLAWEREFREIKTSTLNGTWTD